MKFAATHPPIKNLLALFEREAKIINRVRNVRGRDSLRRQILSEAFFNHGVDGRPIDLPGLPQRKTKNNFQLIAAKIINETLYQYESTAILVLMNGKGKR